MLDQIFDLYSDLEKHRIMLSFKGDLSKDLTGALMSAVERKLEMMETDIRLRKRVFNVVVECLQNLLHNGKAVAPEGVTVSGNEPHGIVMIAHHPQGYSVITGNFVSMASVERLKGRLEKVNALSPDQLRELYKEVLNDGQYSEKGGGGLGFIDIARKSGQKLEYGFVPFDEHNAFFSLNVNVNN
jgi:Family of unknown function (DUF6272)